MNISKTSFCLSILLITHLVVISQNNYDLLYLKGDFDQILATAQNKSTIEDYYYYSLVTNKQGKTTEAICTLEEGIKNYKDNEKLELLISNLYFEAGNLLKAKPYLEKYKEDPEIFMKLIKTLEFENNYFSAIELLKNKIVIDSLNIKYLIHLGNDFYKTDSFELAITYYDKIFKLNPNDQFTAYKLANLYIKTKKLDESIEICNIILKRDSSNKKFIKTKGISSFRKKDFETAETCFSYLLNEGDSSKYILKHLGISEFNNGSFEISREHMQMLFELDSNDNVVCYYLGKGYLNSITPEKGLYYFNRVDSLLQPDPLLMSALYLEKQSIYSTLEMYNNALTCYKLAYEYNAKPEYLFYIASLYQDHLNNNQKALNYYNLFLDKLPPKPDIEHEFDEAQITISLRKLTEQNITSLKEELFFEGKQQH